MIRVHKDASARSVVLAVFADAYNRFHMAVFNFRLIPIVNSHLAWSIFYKLPV